MKCFARVHNLAQVCYTHCVWWILNAHQLIFKSHFEFLNSLHWWYVQYAKTKADLESFISRRIERRSERVLSVVEYHDDGWWRKRADNTDKYSHCNVLNASFTRHPSVVRRPSDVDSFLCLKLTALPIVPFHKIGPMAEAEAAVVLRHAAPAT